MAVAPVVWAEISFGGTNDELSAGAPGFNIGTSGDSAYSICVWVTNGDNNAPDAIMSYSRQTGRFSIEIRRTGFANTVTVLHTSNFTQLTLTGTKSITDGGYHHVCYVQESYTSRKLYVDGTQEASNTTDNTPTGSNAFGNFLIGSNANVSQRWQGRMDGLSAYNRALTASEVETLYLSRSRLLITAGLVNYWPLDQGTDGATVSGSSSVLDTFGADHASPTGAPLWRASTWINYP